MTLLRQVRGVLPRLATKSGPGFTLIELIIVLLIAAVLTTIGIPLLSEFVADQRVRTTASDIVGEIAFARAKAIEQSRRVYIERTGVTWNNGWRIYTDLNSDNNYDVGEELKVFDGFPAGNMYVCSTIADFANNVIFRPDGRVVRVSAVGPNDGIYIIDTMGDGVAANNKIRGLLFGVSGRVTMVRMNGVAPPC